MSQTPEEKLIEARAAMEAAQKEYRRLVFEVKIREDELRTETLYGVTDEGQLDTHRCLPGEAESFINEGAYWYLTPEGAIEAWRANQEADLDERHALLLERAKELVQ